MCPDSRLDRKALGATVETAARHYLIRAGLVDIASNVNFRSGELDLVMLDRHAREGDTLVFIEVRYRRSDAFGGGAASIDARKQQKLIRAASLFLARHPRHAHQPCRFDVIEASGDPAAPHITWLKDAFRP